MNAPAQASTTFPLLAPAAWLAEHLHDPAVNVIAILSRRPRKAACGRHRRRARFPLEGTAVG